MDATPAAIAEAALRAEPDEEEDRKDYPGPSEQRRSDSGSYVWGEVRNAAGKEVKLALSAPNGYDLTVTASLGIAEYILQMAHPVGGYFTPSQLMGADYVLKLPGVRLIEAH